MRTALLLLLVTGTAAAQPAPATDRCGVSLVRAPAEVAAEIDAALASEPQCTTPFELRVVPTDRGLYLVARFRDGRLRDRVVPNARIAGMLVASWAAEPPPAPAGVAAIPAMAVDELATGVRAAASRERSAAAPRWLSVGGLVRAADGRSELRGVRGEVDVFARRRWTLGVAASSSTAEARDVFSSFTITTRDLKLLGYVAYTLTHGRLQLRGSFAAGALHTTADFFDPSALGANQMNTSTMQPSAELAALASVRLGARWALAAGMIASRYDQSFYGANGWAVGYREGELMAFGAVRHSL